MKWTSIPSSIQEQTNLSILGQTYIKFPHIHLFISEWSIVRLSVLVLMHDFYSNDLQLYLHIWLGKSLFIIFFFLFV